MLFVFVCRSLCMFLCRSQCLVWRSLFGNRKVKSWKSSCWKCIQSCSRNQLKVLVCFRWILEPKNSVSKVCFCSLNLLLRLLAYFHHSIHLANHPIEWAWKGVLDAVWHARGLMHTEALSSAVAHLQYSETRCEVWMLSQIKYPAETSALQNKSRRFDMITWLILCLWFLPHFAVYLSNYKTDFYEIVWG